LQLGTAERARSTTAPEDPDALRVAQSALQARIARLRELKPTGRIGLELPEDAKLADLPDVVLEDGDRVFVPVRPAMVSVFGSVFTEGSFLFRPGRAPGDYLSLAGGTTRRADRGQIYVLRADGSAAGQQGLFTAGPNVHVLPGDTIVVPEDYDRQSWTRILRDWATIFYQFGLGAAALKVLRD
jgi:protein involved in polysaccharide export with SLBB domain